METPPASNKETSSINLIEYKVILCGDSYVGKTSILLRLLHNSFSDIQFSTVSGQGYVKEIDLHNGKPPVRLSIWDTAGQEQYNSLVKVFFREADAVILVFDLTNEKSFVNLEKWKSLASSNCPENAIYYVVGNKCDLPEEQRAVNCMKTAGIQKDLGATAYLSCSAKSGEGIEELFLTIAKDVPKLIKEAKEPLKPNNRNNGKKCCK